MSESHMTNHDPFVQMARVAIEAWRAMPQRASVLDPADEAMAHLLCAGVIATLAQNVSPAVIASMLMQAISLLEQAGKLDVERCARVMKVMNDRAAIDEAASEAHHNTKH